MCPTELLFEAGKPPAIELLPIETRSTNASVAEFKRFPEEWRVVALDTGSADAMHSALARVGEQKRVARSTPKLGFAIEADGKDGLKPDAEGLVEIPCWRHAVINFPHPLLEQGLVILDTPGLNAIGAEPELTLSQLPSAHAILFILAADTGVTQSDLAVWRDHVNGARHPAARAASPCSTRSTACGTAPQRSRDRRGDRAPGAQHVPIRSIWTAATSSRFGAEGTARQASSATPSCWPAAACRRWSRRSPTN
jgi:hypothetical protein